MKDPVFFKEHVQQDAQETLSKLLRLLPLSYQRHFEGVQVDNRHCECGAAAATTCEMLGVSIPVIGRSPRECLDGYCEAFPQNLENSCA